MATLAATQICPKCKANVPTSNFALHDARCGNPHKPSPAPAEPIAKTSAEETVAKCVLTGVLLARELTWARTQPREVAEALKERLMNYRGKDYFPPERHGRCIVTKEGAAVVEEAIAFLNALAPMRGVGFDSEPGLALAGEDHVVDIGQTGAVSHNSSDGTTAAERQHRYGTFSCFGECLWYGSDNVCARSIVLDLIVDDGVASRGHRKGIYNPAYDAVGVAIGAHATFGRVVALEFARAWQGNPMFIRSRMQAGPVQMDEKVVAAAKASASTQWSLGVCLVCNEQIKGGRVVEIQQLGSKVHADCFKCCGCSASLTGGPYKFEGGALYCNSCFFGQFGEKCVACDSVIRGGKMKCAMGTFHVECVICAVCKKNVGKSSFSMEGGVITCQACATQTKRGVMAPGKAYCSTLTAAGGRIASGALARAASPPARPGSAPKVAAKASTKAKAKPKASGLSAPRAKEKVSMTQANSTLQSLGMDYAALC
jgi:uncharacterized protein YkwD